jgi:hypothetical protein
MIKNIVISYDIACQWSRNFSQRMRTCFPATWAINVSQVGLRFLVPKFHISAHVEKCQQDYSFNYTKGVGRTDGEAPERGWSNLNALSSSTKEMGPGSRQDTIEDHVGDWNWKKVVAMGKYVIYQPQMTLFSVSCRYVIVTEDEDCTRRKGEAVSGMDGPIKSSRPSTGF